LANLEKIQENIGSIINLNQEEWLAVAAVLEKKLIKKNDFFLQEGQVSTSIAFVDEGVLIYYKTLENANEVTTDFAFENEWVTNNHSRLNATPSLLNIKAIEDSILLVIQQKDLLNLYDKIPRLERFGRLLMEQAYIKLVELSVDLQTLSATDRYNKLVENYPEIFQRVPLHHIANYLGVAPKSLSRIRNTIFSKK